ncbi:MAG: hypothetical protein OEY88_06915 [Candidatus Bathyarchaeota archaeon]|nr:hypothetical protein [Candidatus Bathyarchaeota archaeon]
MKWTPHFKNIEKLIAQDNPFAFTVVSLLISCMIYLNNVYVKSPIIGTVTFLFFFSINTIFLEHVFFEKEDVFFRLMFGVLLLIMLLGFVGWLIMIIYNLDAPKFTLVLFIVSTLSSLLNRRMKHKNVT